MGSILDQYKVVLLDMNGTFMFGEDRFGPDHDYYVTYRELSGTRLTSRTVRRAIDDCYCRMAAVYEDPNRIDSFPQVREVLAESPECIGLPAAEVELLERVIARHELGHIPDEYVTALRQLAATHRLGIVTNIWSRKSPWLEELQRAGVLDLFAVVVVSSDGPSMKPSPSLFQQALAAIGVSSPFAVFVGDSLRCDIGGAVAAGLDAVWVNLSGAARPPGAAIPTFEIRSLLELARATPRLSEFNGTGRKVGRAAGRPPLGVKWRSAWRRPGDRWH